MFQPVSQLVKFRELLVLMDSSSPNLAGGTFHQVEREKTIAEWFQGG